MPYNKHDIAEAVQRMDAYLHETLSDSPKKLWENTYTCRQIERRSAGGRFTTQDHIRGMVYAMLSGGVAWERVESGIDLTTGRIVPIDEAFHEYDPDYLMKCDPAALRDTVRGLGYASQYTLKQMTALVRENVKKLLVFEKTSGSIDAYYQTFIGLDPTLKMLVHQLSSPDSLNKLGQMGVALVAEYLKNCGYDLAKPDRHICRILGSGALGCSEHETVPAYEAFEIVAEIADELNEHRAKVDFTLWSYCATGYGAICTSDKPRHDICAAREICCYRQIGVNKGETT